MEDRRVGGTVLLWGQGDTPSGGWYTWDKDKVVAILYDLPKTCMGDRYIDTVKDYFAFAKSRVPEPHELPPKLPPKRSAAAKTMQMKARCLLVTTCRRHATPILSNTCRLVVTLPNEGVPGLCPLTLPNTLSPSTNYHAARSLLPQIRASPPPRSRAARAQPQSLA